MNIEELNKAWIDLMDRVLEENKEDALRLLNQYSNKPDELKFDAESKRLAEEYKVLIRLKRSKITL